MVFDAETFVSECRAAAVEDDPVAAVQEVVAAAIVDGPSIDAALGTELKRDAPLFSRRISPCSASSGLAGMSARCMTIGCGR